MGRPQRVDVAGYAYHVLNRSVGRRRIFAGDGDYLAFERVMAQALARAGGVVELLSYCLMPNHWHLVVRLKQDGVMSPFVKWLTLTHTQRYRVADDSVGDGPLYQGRFKSFLIGQDRHFLTVCRYVERNAARADLVSRAEDWRWSSLWRLRQPDPGRIEGASERLELADWPVSGSRPRQWLRTVNMPLNTDELAALRRAVERSRPYGDEAWMKRLVERFGLGSAMRGRGRPRQPG